MRLDSSELRAAVELLEYRVGRLKRLTAEHESAPKVILSNEIYLINDALGKVQSAVEKSAEGTGED